MASTPKIPIVLFAVFASAMIVFGLSQFLKVSQAQDAAVWTNQLRQIDSAKNQWALEQGKSTNDLPAWSDLSNYISAKAFPGYFFTNGALVGSNGDVYTIGRVGESPSCLIDGKTFTLSH